MSRNRLDKQLYKVVGLTVLMQILLLWQVVGQCNVEKEKQIIQDLYDAGWRARTDLPGDNWNDANIDNYPSWKGIETWREAGDASKGDCIYQLQLDRAASTGTISPSIGDFYDLRFLWLNNNDLTGTIPNEIFLNEGLSNLYLQNNSFTPSDLTGFGNLTELITFGFSDNENGFSETNFPDLSGLTKVNKFYLKGHEFNDLPNFQYGPAVSGRVNNSGTRDLQVEANRLTFEDLMPIAQLNIDFFRYSNQKNFRVTPNNYSATAGVDFTIDLGVDGNVDGNRYQWYRNNEEIQQTSVNELTTNEANPGTYIYRCEITNNTFNTLTNSSLTVTSEDISVTVNAVNNGCRTTDRAALIAIYDALDGDNWAADAKLNWKSNLSLDQWGGITTNDDGCVIKIELIGKNLNGTFPTQFGDLSELEELKLNDNNIPGPVPTSLGNLEKLRVLHIANMNLGGNLTNHSVVFEITSLEELLMYQNEISGNIPPSIGNASKTLSSLSLGDNNLTGNLPTEIYSLTKLFRFHINGNELTGSISPLIGNFTDLDHLWISDNNFSGAIPAELGNNALDDPNKRLWLENNQFTFGDLIPITEFPNLGTYSSIKYAPQAGFTTTTPFTGKEGETLELTVDFKDGPNNTYPNLYSWYKEGETVVAFEHSNVNTYTINPLALTDAGEYEIRVTNPSFQAKMDERFDDDNPILEIISTNKVAIIVTEGNAPPTDITLDKTTINSDALAGSLVGNLATVDADENDTHTYTITDNCNPDAVNNGLFDINENRLLLANDFVLPVDVTTLTVCITSTDNKGASYPKLFRITVNVVEDDCVARDRAALTAIYDAMGGTAWGNGTNWLAVGIPLNQWFGVTTNDLGCVTELNLAGNNLVDEIPAEVGNLLELERLDLGRNAITGTIPNEVTQLSELRTFGVAMNKLTGTLPANFNNLSLLQRLWIDDNNFSGTFPAVLLSMTSLTEIFMQINQYNGTLPDGFNSLTNLVSLNLGNNGFTGELPATIGNLGNLTLLGLYNNAFTGKVPESYTNLTNLDAFGIQGNELESLIPEGIAGNNNFNDVTIEENKFTFQDVLPFIGRAAVTYTYAPQDSVGIGGDFIINQGETLPVDLGIDPNITNNVYQWYKDSALFGDSFNVGTIELSEPGSYTCSITNPRAPDLELWSRVITLRVNDNAPTDILLSNSIIDAVDALPNFLIGTLSTVDEDIPKDTHTYTLSADCTEANNNNLFAINGEELLLSPTFILGAAVTSLNVCITTTDQSGNSFTKNFEITIRPTIDDCVANDRAVLEAIYDALGGGSGTWGNSTNWKTDAPLADWFGIETNDNGCVTRILLEANNLAGDIPAEVGNLSEVIEINFGKNAITGSIPADFGKLATLEILWLNENNLGGQIPEGFFGMSNLTNLYLFRNNFSPPMPNQLNQLTKLFVFGFDNNVTPFSDADFPAISSLAVLQKFYIQNHNFENVPTITNPELLTEIGLADNRFTFEDILPFSGLDLDVFSYAPQDSIGEQSAVTIQAGEPFTFDLGIDPNVTTSTYKWYKDGNQIDESNSNIFIIDEVAEDDAGEYTCIVTNSDAPDLTLFSRKTVLTVTPQTDLPPPVLSAELDPTNPAERIILTWTYSAGFTPTSYTIERSVGDSLNFEVIAENQTGQNFTDGSGLTPGETYYYRVSALVDNETSPYSNVAFVTTNSLPTVADIDKIGPINTSIPFTLQDFSDAFEDVDGDQLDRIQILSLPQDGQLLLNNVVVNLNDEILSNEIVNLVFAPDQDFAGTTSFEYNASDGFNYARTSANVNISIEEVEDVDLQVNNAGTNTSEVQAGGTITISGTLTIEGGPTNNDAVFVLLLSQDTIPDQNDISLGSSIVPAQSSSTSQQVNTEISLPEDLAPGEYFIIYFVDAAQDVLENNEFNNIQFVRITILAPVEEPAITIMNMITANRDGFNDNLYIKNIESYPDNEVILLDRWGNEIFRTTGYQNDWEPVLGESILDFGAYVCIVKVGEPQLVFKRMVSIMRGNSQ